MVYKIPKNRKVKKIFVISKSKEFYKGRKFSTKKPFVVLRIDPNKDVAIPNKLVYTINEGKNFIKNKEGKYAGKLKWHIK